MPTPSIQITLPGSIRSREEQQASLCQRKDNKGATVKGL